MPEHLKKSLPFYSDVHRNADARKICEYIAKLPENLVEAFSHLPKSTYNKTFYGREISFGNYTYSQEQVDSRYLREMERVKSVFRRMWYGFDHMIEEKMEIGWMKARPGKGKFLKTMLGRGET